MAAPEQIYFLTQVTITKSVFSVKLNWAESLFPLETNDISFLHRISDEMGNHA